MFKVNQIVRGKVCGYFVVLGFKTVGGEPVVVLKGYNPETGAKARGQLCLPEDCLVAA